MYLLHLKVYAQARGDDMMRIGQIAKQAGVSTSMLRYYEDLGLLAPGTRTEAGYRVYGPDALGRLGFIQRAKALGLSLQEIRRLLQEPAGSSTQLARLRHAIAHKVADTQRRIAELEALRQELEALYQRLSNGEAPCGHLGDCACWLPTGEEVKTMPIQVPELTVLHESATPTMVQMLPLAGTTLQHSAEAGDTVACSCCGCVCPSDEACPCCGCECPNR